MNITRDTKVIVTLPYTYVDGQVGTVIHPADGVNELHTVRLDSGQTVSLYESEFKLYSEPKDILSEKIRERIREYQEVSTSDRTYELGIIQGLEYALDILNED